MSESQVWIVFHGDDDRESPCELKIIGVFSSKELAESAVEASRSLPGFNEWPDLFHIGPYRIDKRHWTEGFVRV